MIGLEFPRLGYDLCRTPGFIKPSPFRYPRKIDSLDSLRETISTLFQYCFPFPCSSRAINDEKGFTRAAKLQHTSATGDTGTTHESIVHETLSPSFLIELASTQLVSGSVCAAFFRIVWYFCTNPWLPSTELSIISPPDMSADGFHIASPPESDFLTASTITRSVIDAVSFNVQRRACTNPILSPPTVANKPKTLLVHHTLHL